MFELVIDYVDTNDREVTEKLTAREMAELISDRSKKYTLVFDMINNVISALGCTLWFTAIPRD